MKYTPSKNQGAYQPTEEVINSDQPKRHSLLPRLPTLTAISLVALTGCAAFEKNPIPGAKNNAVKMEGIQVSTVLSALKVQLARAVDEIDTIKKNNPSHPVSTMNLKTGSGKITATVKSVKGNSGNLIKGVIPFSGFAGSLLTPEIGGDWAAESTRLEELAFKIDPEKKAGRLDYPGLENIVVGTAVQDAIIDRYNDLLAMPAAKKGTNYGPEITAQSITMTFEFAAERKLNGSVEIKFIPSSPTFSEVNSTLGGNRGRSISNQLTITLPCDIGDSNDPRRLFYAVKGAYGSVYVEEPYTKKRYDELLKSPPSPGAEIIREPIIPFKLQMGPAAEPAPF